MKALLVIMLAIAILPGKTIAQDSSPYGYYFDALRFSSTYSGGSARTQALGGSNVALGAEMTSISGNPAGLGMFNRSEISITPGFTFATNQTRLNGSKTNNQSIYGHLDNIGLVINNISDGTKGWLGGSFGFSVNKISDFNSEFKYSAGNAQNSLVDYFIESAYGISEGNIPALEEVTDITSLAYYTYLIGPLSVIDPADPDDEYFSDVTSFIRPSLNQEELIKTSGSQYQWSLSYGGNLADVLYVGFGLGVVSLNYNAQKTYVESNFDYSANDPSYEPINSINLDEELNVTGTGINGTFGLIIRPVAFFRLGASITTPTMYQLKDTYNGTLAADWNNFLYSDVNGDTTLNYLEASTAQVASRYRLSTPLKATVGTAIFLGKLGFITADIEYLDYGSTWLESNDFSMDADNDYIKNNFGEALNLKAGIEIRLDALRLRAGYALDQVPITANIDYKSSNQRISAGIGLHLENFYADFTVVNSQINSDYSPYTLADNSHPEIQLWTNNFSGLLTLGFSF